MRDSQNITPKYWVANNKNSDDVIIETASKAFHHAEEKLIKMAGDDYEDKGFDIKCIEIRFVTDSL